MITPSFALTATERVLPKLALDFTTASLDSRITFTRTTGASNPATYINSSGFITAATNNQPRFDYDPVTLACKGLLIEESRSNLVINSNEFNSGWTLSSVTVSSDSADTLSPDGTNNADKIIIDNGVSSGSNVFNQQTFAKAASAKTYTASVFAKAGGFNFVRIRCRELANFANEATCVFDLAAGTADTPSIAGTFTNVSAKIVRYKEDFYRCSLTFTSGTETEIAFRILPQTGTGDGVKGIYCFGAQFEEGGFPTSYIPTTTPALTRNADVATMTGTNFSSWYNQTQGTFVLQASRYVGTGGSMTHFSVSDGTNLEWYRMYSSGSDGVEYFTGLDNSVSQWDRSRSSVTSDTPFQLCGSYKENAINFALNGSAAATDTSATIPTVDRLLFGQLGNGTAGYGRQHIRKLMYYPQSFTSAETAAFSKQG